MSTYRTERLQELLRHEIGSLLLRDLSLKGALITILGVSISPDGKHAAVHYSVLPSSRRDAATLALKAVSPELQHQLFQRLPMRPIPLLRFVLDTSGETASRIDELLRKAHATPLPKTPRKRTIGKHHAHRRKTS